MIIETYQKFKWWQKGLFYIGLPQILNLMFWIFFLPLFYHLNDKYKTSTPKKEVITKLLYYFGYVHLTIIIIFLVVFVIGFER